MPDVLVTNHVLSGAILGAVLPGPRSAFAVGVASHFALDALPHWGDVTWDELVRVGKRDGVVGLATMALVTAMTSSDRRAGVVAGMAGAAFPDLDKPSKLFFGRSFFPRSWDRFHEDIQRESRRRMPQEFVVGAALFAVALAVGRR